MKAAKKTIAPRTVRAPERAAAKADSGAEGLAARLRMTEERRAELRRRTLALLSQGLDRAFTTEEVAEAIALPDTRIATVDEELFRLTEEGAIDAHIAGGRWTYRRPAMPAPEGTFTAEQIARPNGEEAMSSPEIEALAKRLGCDEAEATARAIRFMLAYTKVVDISAGKEVRNAS